MVTEIKEEVKTRVCIQCGKGKPETFFRESKRYFRHGAMPKLYRVKICNDCEFKNRRRVQPTIQQKARTFISSHSAKLGVDSQTLADWGITKKFIVYLIERELTLILSGFHYCPNCLPEERKVKEECFPKKLLEQPDEKGLLEILKMISIDVIDKERMIRTGKLTRSNVRTLCLEANRYKAASDPTDYDIRVVNFNKDKLAFIKGIPMPLNLNGEKHFKPTLFDLDALAPACRNEK